MSTHSRAIYPDDAGSVLSCVSRDRAVAFYQRLAELPQLGFAGGRIDVLVDGCHHEPEPLGGFHRLEARLRQEQWTVERDHLRGLKRAFDQCGIEIPLPQIRSHVPQPVQVMTPRDAPA